MPGESNALQEMVLYLPRSADVLLLLPMSMMLGHNHNLGLAAMNGVLGI